MSDLRILLSGGGSGGHIYPALAIADRLKALRPEAEFLFVGAEGKMEMRRVPAAGYDIVGLPVSGFHRKLDKRNLMFPFKLGSSLLKAWQTVKKFNPHVAIGTGGYASGPALAAAGMQGAPIFIQEQNAYPGVTNRLLGKMAKVIFQAYPEADSYFASAKTLHTGNPLRKSLSASESVDVAKARTSFKLDPNKPTLLSFGGSQGARSMNLANKEMTAFWRENQQFQLVWQTGEGYFDAYQHCETAQLPNVCCVPYLERMDLAYAAADLVACRAGALSISELQLLSKPALLIPSPNVAGDHQTANAKAIEAAGAALLVRDDQQVEELSNHLSGLLADMNRLKGLASNMGSLAKPKAAEEIAQEILKYV